MLRPYKRNPCTATVITRASGFSAAASLEKGAKEAAERRFKATRILPALYTITITITMNAAAPMQATDKLSCFRL